MHVLDESTNIAANLHCLWLIFHLTSREDNFTMHSGKSLCILRNFFIEKRSKTQVSFHLPAISGQQYWLKLVAQLFVFDKLLRDSSLLEIGMNDCYQLLGL